MKIPLVFLSLSVSLIFAGCAGSMNQYSATSNANANTSKVSYPSSVSTSNSSMSNSSTTTAAKRGGGGGGGGKETALVKQQVSLDQAGKSQTPVVPTERKIIRNAEMTLEADAPEDAQQKITTIAESKGGFVIESQRQISDTKATKTDSVMMTVRVPAAKFDEALDEIRKSGTRVTREDVKGQDVTEEFIDVEARLKTQKALEAQFLEIMKQAKTVDDALNVQREIADVRGEIEKFEGRKKFLENQSEFSTLKILLESPAVASSSGFFYQLGDSVRRGFDAAMTFVFGLIYIVIALLPFLIFIVLPIYLLLRYFLRKSRKQKLASEIAQEEIKNG